MRLATMTQMKNLDLYGCGVSGDISGWRCTKMTGMETLMLAGTDVEGSLTGWAGSRMAGLVLGGINVYAARIASNSSAWRALSRRGACMQARSHQRLVHAFD